MTYQKLTFAFLASCFLCICSLNYSIVQAGYVPPPNQKKAPPNTKTGSGTTRGCEGNTLPPTILASGNQVSQTISNNPTFAWMIDEGKSLDMNFIVYEYTQDHQYRKIYHQTQKTHSGIMTLTFPNTELSLRKNQTYVIQVVIFCESNFPSTALYDQVYFEIVDVPSELEAQLEKTLNSQERVNLYAQSGLWFDALNEALNITNLSSLGDSGKALLKELITKEKAILSQDTNNARILNLEQIYNSK